MKPYYEKDGVTIFHGDMREVLSAWPKASVDMIFTDPPYGHNNNNNGDLIHRWEAALGGGEVREDDKRPIANDGAEAVAELVPFLYQRASVVLAADGCCCCCCGGGGPDPQFARWAMWMDEWLTFKQMVVWDKGPIGMGWHYRRSYETILVGHRGQSCRWYDETDKIENIIRPGAHGIKKIIPQEDDHPTPKPWQLPAHFVQLHTKPGDVVMDPFMGGGSTLEACHRLGRRFVGIELEESYIAMAIKRIAQPVLL